MSSKPIACSASSSSLVAGVNIANMAVSRTREGGEALMVFSIDTQATSELEEALHAMGFDDIHFVELG